jgi:preprotein translocase subunit SecA
LMRLFGQERLMNVFNALGVDENERIEHKMLSSAIEKAQKKIETNNYGIRSHLLQYDQVMNEQREIIYAERNRVLNGESMRNSVIKMITDFVESVVNRCIGEDASPKEWDYTEINELLLPTIPLEPVVYDESIKNKNELLHTLKEKALKMYEDKEAQFPEPEQIREIERVVLLKVIDRKWMDHIDDMDQLKQGIGLQAYGQRDPVVQYKVMGYDMFDAMTTAITEDTVRLLMHIQVEQKVEREQVAKVTGTNKDEGASVKGPVKRVEKKVYPNDLCPCGSGKKYKNCCGRQA